MTPMFYGGVRGKGKVRDDERTTKAAEGEERSRVKGETMKNQMGEAVNPR